MSAASPAAELLIPVRSIRALPGAFVWPRASRLASCCAADELPLQQLAGGLPGLPRIVFGAGCPADLRVRRTPSVAGPESYRISITPDGIDIEAEDDPGAAYALATLRDLVRLHGPALPACRIADRPDFPRRGVYLDCSRGKVPTRQTLQRLIGQLADWKINELQLYIENVFRFQRHPDIGRGFSPFSPGDLIRLQEYARPRHVRLVPSLASFGHLERILALPAYRRLGEKPGHYGMPGGTTLCPGDPGAIQLIADLYDEFLPLFATVDFNACCDETWALGSGRSRRRAARLGVDALYLEFILKLHRLCQRHGKRMNIWADILLNHPRLVDRLPDDIVLLNWEYDPRGPRIPRSRKLAAAGRAFLVCPGTHGWRSHGSRLPEAIANVARFARTGRRCGADGLLITDWGDYGHRNPLGASLHAFAHAAAHAWHGAGVDDARFTRRFYARRFDRRVAGAAAALAEALGHSERLARAPLYFAISQSLDGANDPFRGIPPISPVWQFPGHRPDVIGAAHADGCRRLIETLEDALAAPGAAESGDLALAARMDLLAARRILAGQALRAGTPRSSRERRALADETRRLAGEFAANWRTHYRPSRLRDNLRLFANAADDSGR